MLRSLSKYKIVLLLLLLALLLRLPWLYTIVHKDEGQIGYVAWRWMSGEHLYSELNDNKPPLLYVIYSIPILFFGNSIIPIRIWSNIFFLISIIFFFKLMEHAFSKKTASLSTLFYTVFMSIPAFEGYFALSEIFLTPFLMISIYSIVRYVSIKKTYLILVSSTCATISALIKHQSVFIFFVLISAFFLYKEKNKTKKIMFFILTPLAVLVFMCLFYNTSLYYFLRITWLTFFKSPFGLAAGYRYYPYNLTILAEGSILFLFSMMGLLRFIKSKKEKKTYFFLSWLFFAALFALIPPAYGRYYLFLIPPLAVFAGIGLNYSIDNYFNKKIFIALVAVLSLITGTLVANHFPDSNLNMGHFQYKYSGLESYDQQKRIAEYVKTTTKPADEIFVLDWEPVIYWMSERTPPKDLGFSQNPAWMDPSRLRWALEKQKNLKLVIFTRDLSFLEDYFYFLTNKKVIHGVIVYEMSQDIKQK